MKDYRFVLYMILNLNHIQLDELLDKFSELDVIYAVRGVIENGKDLCLWTIYFEIFDNAIWNMFGDEYHFFSKKLSLILDVAKENFTIGTSKEFYKNNKDKVDRLADFMGMDIKFDLN